MRCVRIGCLLLTILIVTFSGLSQAPASLLEGEIGGFKNCAIVLFRTVKGVQQKYAGASITRSENRFSFALPVSGEGEFVRLLISDFDLEGIKEKHREHYQVEFYLRPGVQLEVSIKLKQNALQPSLPECSMVSPSPENVILLGWQKMRQQFRASFQDEDPAVRVKKFSTAYGQYKPKLTAYIGTAICKTNPEFQKVFREAATAHLQFAPIDFYSSNGHYMQANSTDAFFYKILKQAYADLQSYCGDAVFRLEGVSNLSRYYQLLYREKYRSGNTASVAVDKVPADSVKSLICNQTVKAYFGAQASGALSPRADTSQWIPISTAWKNSHLAFVRVLLNGFTTTSDITLTAFEKVNNRTLVSVRPTNNCLLVPVQLSQPTMLSFEFFDLKTTLFLCPGESVDLYIYNTVSGAAGTKLRANYTVKVGSEENIILAKWYAFAYPVTRHLQSSMLQPKAISADQFQHEYDFVSAGLDAFVRDSTKHGNVEFRQLFGKLSLFDLRLSALMFLARMQNPTGYAGPFFKGYNPEKVPAFFKQFKDGGILCDSAVYTFPYANLLVSYISKLQWNLKPDAEKEKIPVGAKLAYQLDQLCAPQAKSCLFAWQMMANELAINWREVKLNCLPNKDLFVTDEMKANYSRVVDVFAADTQFIGKPVINMPFSDTSGRSVRLSDFKGKVVFIDVWATWCAPCREQLPYLLKIEEEYRHNPDIVFVGLSVDREKDKEKWRKFIATEKLKGTQIIDYSGKLFQTKYQIPAIPRFILIDKKGNISEMRCPYPVNDKELKAYLNELLETPA